VAASSAHASGAGLRLPQTAAFIAERLREIGVDEIHEGIAKTGIVALIKGQKRGAR
jgi:metal-dependent amidase/aminoacylase/carboxypeptidase family protein